MCRNSDKPCPGCAKHAGKDAVWMFFTPQDRVDAALSSGASSGPKFGRPFGSAPGVLDATPKRAYDLEPRFSFLTATKDSAHAGGFRYFLDMSSV